jgi:heme-degrading monooxygenase HmoA
MYARTIVADVIPGKADEAVRIFEEQIVPVIKEQPGFVSTAIYIDEDKKKAQTVSFWESKQAMLATSQGTPYLSKVTGMLRSCIVNRHYDLWEVGFSTDR